MTNDAVVRGRDSTVESVDEKEIWLTDEDLDRLRILIAGYRNSSGIDRTNLESLERELDRARVVPPSEIPEDVITMNSRVRLLDLDSHDERVVTLVFPSEANIDRNRISVLAPIGTAILGYRRGDRITWRVPGGIRHLRVEAVLYQPEAADPDRHGSGRETVRLRA